MMYHTLAHVYDALVKDDEATHAWVEFIKKHVTGKELLEVACGSGEITIALAKEGYHIHASDLSADMIEEAKKKTGSERITWNVMDMSKLELTSFYDGILCLCDSFNYLLDWNQVKSFFQASYDHLKVNGTLIVDMHSLDRLDEFQEEYNEAGHVNGIEYQWTIHCIDDRIYQNFAFYDENGRVTLEQHEQRVYLPKEIIEKLEEIGFQVTVYTDFDKEGICEGEKQFYVCKKVGNNT